MKKVLFRRMMHLVIVCLVMFTQSVAYAVEVIIEDPTPDMEAPILNSISVTSNALSPTTPVKVIADISDQLSGFKSGYIIYTKPNGQNKTVSFIFNSTTKMYEATITVPEVDVAGEWKATTVYLQDNKENTVYLSHLSTQANGEKIDFSNLTLNVAVAEPTDKEAPLLRTISVVSQQVKVNEKIEVVADATDNESGVSSIRAIYKKPSGSSASISLIQNTAGQFIGSFTIGKYEESGEWVLSSIYLVDKDGNSRTVTSYIDAENVQKTFSHCKVTVSGTTVDKEAPVLHGISVASEQVKANGKIEITAEVTDNESGVSFVTVYYRKPDGTTQSAYLYKNTTGQFIGSISIGQFEERGKWLLTSVYLRDVVGNSKTVTNYLGVDNTVQDFTNCTVDIIDTTPDREGPEIYHRDISVQQISASQAAVKLVVEARDSLSGIANSPLSGVYRKPSGKLLNLSFQKQNNQYIAVIPIDKYDELGTWTLQSLSIRDAVGNYNSPLNRTTDSTITTFDINVWGKITVDSGTPESIRVEAPTVLSSGQTYQLHPFLRYSNPGVEDEDITSDSKTTYSTSDPTLLTINSTGQMIVPSGAGSGIVYVGIGYGDIEEQVEIKINNGTIDPVLQVNPLFTTLHAGQSEQMKVVEISDRVRTDITNSSSGIVYTSSNPSLVTVTKDGFIQAVTGEVQGLAVIKATYNNLESQTTVKVTKPAVESLVISPTEESLSLTSNKLQLILNAFMTDGTAQNVTQGVTGTKYTSSNQLIAQVGPDGMVTIPSNAKSGDVTISATNGGRTAKAILHVTGVPEVVEINSGTTELQLTQGSEHQLKVIGKLSDGTDKDITGENTGTVYTSVNTTIAEVDANGSIKIPSNAPLGYSSQVKIENNGLYSYVSVKVIDPSEADKPKEIYLNTESIELARGEEYQLSVTADTANGTRDVTASSEGTVYSSTFAAAANVDSEGLITVPANAPVGYSTNIRVVNNGISKYVTVKIIDKLSGDDPTSLSVPSDLVELKRSETYQLAVSAETANGTRDVTASSTGTKYSSTNTSIAQVSAEGLVTVSASAAIGYTADIRITNNGITKVVKVKVIDVSAGDKPTSLSVPSDLVELKRSETYQLAVSAETANGTRDVTASSTGTKYSSTN
ncbi:hypothetical protein M3221_24405, partial [Domibacillus indicus]|uniref:hypothetical protein n=1 Tax=Domibacillus indicus TaxID=1437523 RepID=UPI0020420169